MTGHCAILQGKANGRRRPPLPLIALERSQIILFMYTALIYAGLWRGHILSVCISQQTLARCTSHWYCNAFYLMPADYCGGGSVYIDSEQMAAHVEAEYADNWNCI